MTGVAAAAGAAVAGGFPRAAWASKRVVVRPATHRPNVIVISFDDLPWNGFGCYGNEFHETPVIDRLAGSGMRFTQSYAAAPVCSPTRAALMTGLFPARTGITNRLQREQESSDLYLRPRFLTVPEQLAARGYRSVLIGKWHLTEDYSGPYLKRRGNPYVHGFDDVLLSEERYIALGDMFFPYRILPSVTRGVRNEYLTDRIARDTARWISRHAGQPFFMHVSNYATHYPWEAPKALVDKYSRKKKLDPRFATRNYQPALAAMVERCDRQVGRIVRAVRDAGIAENTLILLTSDNGGGRSTSRPLRGSKGSLYEGGIRVPLVAYWPGIVPAGTTSDAVVSTVDLFPTINDIAGGGEVTGLDGLSLEGILSAQQDLTRDTYWYFPHAFGGAVPSAAVRSGQHKLIKQLDTGSLELYDIVGDPIESINLVESEPEIAEALHEKLRAHIADMQAATATTPT